MYFQTGDFVVVEPDTFEVDDEVKVRGRMNDQGSVDASVVVGDVAVVVGKMLAATTFLALAWSCMLVFGVSYRFIQGQGGGNSISGS